ncbi:MAG TPA: MBL fold metallo-hydrolase [Tepidisphaeraceae bacterium]|jgi:metallo-beta-lactamase family protein|nr:MBL fold metallo-hydrolase [Tepidisphaeraceae bacterium]
MRIQFCGADRTVTGSSHLIEINGLRIFLDMGMYQGPRQEARQINQYLPADVKTADAIVLSHAHLDHCGKLPIALRGGFHGPIYCTPATAQVTRIVLNDAAKIQQEDADHLNRHARDTADPNLAPLYGPADIPPVLKLFRQTPNGQKTDLGKGVGFTYFDAGHILGSAFVFLEWTEAGRVRNLLFTGDVGRYNAPILRDPVAPPAPAQQIITESTYGNTTHGPIEQVGPQLLDAVKFILSRRSRMIVPSFAIGRTQTILWYLQKFVHEKLIPQIPIFVDSPMATEATKVYSQFRDEYDEQTRALIGQSDLFGLAHVTCASTPQESKQINRQAGPCVIVASSPTCEFGRVLHHLERSVENPDDLIVFCGYIPPNTLGRRIQDGQKRVRIYDRWYDLRCQVRTIHGLSAHGDSDELIRFLTPAFSPSTEAYVVHGEVPQAEAFARRLLAAGISRATIPAMESSVDAYSVVAPGQRVEPGHTDQE